MELDDNNDSEYTNEQGNFIRFQYELEFVQMLSNPNYLECISLINIDLLHNGYFEDPAFINFLKYLLYWKQPEYTRFLMYMLPNILDILYHLKYWTCYNTKSLEIN